ncbi:MAG: hypothetical protein NVSMB9_28480 [Isosphaeraceae bacterium]
MPPLSRKRPSRASLMAFGIIVCGHALFPSSSPASGERENSDPVAAETAWIVDGFETTRTSWNQEQTDATINLIAHDRTNRAAHEGRTSEHFRFAAGLGSGFYFSHVLPKVPVLNALQASLHVRANRAGVQLFARVILPGDTDPETKQPSFLLVPGTIYESVDRWQRLEVVDLETSLARQARVLRASTGRRVSLEGAYVEQLVVNLFAGSGETEVFLDEMKVGPVSPALAAQAVDLATSAERAEVPRLLARSPSTTSIAQVRLDLNRLKKRAEDGLFHDWFFTAIHAPGADVASLRRAGFDVLIDEIDTDPKRFQEAVEKGFLLMPKVGAEGSGRAADPAQVIAAVTSFPFRGSVMAWNLGDRLGLTADLASRKDELASVRSIVTKMRSLPAGVSRLTTGTVSDDLSRYARSPKNLDLLGIRPTPWGTSHAPMETLEFLRQRRVLTARSNSGAFFWAELPAISPPEVTRAVWGDDLAPSWGLPTVQAEQIRVMTYGALSAGYRGLAFRGDANLTRPAGRMLLLEMALLNAEIDLCESILANGADPIPTYSAYDPDPPTLPPPGGQMNRRVATQKELAPLGAIRSAAIGTRDKKGVLMLVTDYVGGGQFQPAQSARNDMKITVIVPEGAQAFEVRLGGLRVLERERAVGGTRITIPEFDTTALILITTDVSMAERVEAVIHSIRPGAVQMAIEQAELKLQWVTDINGRLAADGHFLIGEKEQRRRVASGGTLPDDQAELLNKAAENIKTARENAERLDWEDAWSEARRASRPLRILMRGHWTNAQEAMERANTPAEDLANEEAIQLGRARPIGLPQNVPTTASPPLVAFNTLPQHYLWVDWMKAQNFGKNLIASGAFNEPEGLEKAGWTNASYQMEGIQSRITTVTNRPEGEGVLKMSVEPARKGGIDALPPFLDHPVAAIRSPAVKVEAGQFLRISVRIKRVLPTIDGYGGVLVRDSIGGEPLQFVSTEPFPKMTRVVLYRRAAASGELTVLLGLAGYGEAYFDDLSVQRVESAQAPRVDPPGIARLPRRRSREDHSPTANRPGTRGGPSR